MYNHKYITSKKMRKRPEKDIQGEEYINIIYPKKKEIARKEVDRVLQIKKKIPNTDFLDLIQSVSEDYEYNDILLEKKIFTKSKILKSNIQIKRK